MRPNRRSASLRTALADFLRTERAAAGILLCAAAVAMLWANLVPGYEVFWTRTADIGGSTHEARAWVNDGLMSLFFLLVGIEIKREFTTGELRNKRTALVPIIAAIGGMAVPAAIYLAFNASGPGRRGWSVPMATDIAFALGAVALLGRHVPQQLRVFLLTLAIVDDIGSVAVIAIFYSGGLIHPPIIAVALGLLLPARSRAGRMVERFEHFVHPLSAYVFVPVFALANAGVRMNEDSLGAAARSSVFWGIVAGLVVGKLVGVVGASVLAERIGIGTVPTGLTRRALAGGAAFAGIGFTVSLFIVRLAFTDPAVVQEAILAVLTGSLCSALVGSVIVLRRRPDTVTAE